MRSERVEFKQWLEEQEKPKPTKEERKKLAKKILDANSQDELQTVIDEIMSKGYTLTNKGVRRKKQENLKKWLLEWLEDVEL